MYLKLRNIKEVDQIVNDDDFMIFAEIPDTKISYEKPVLVRTIDELSIWFGKDFKDYNLLKSLLGRGRSLYLYGPVEKENTKGENYIDLDTYVTNPRLYTSNQLSELKGENVIYKIVDSDGKYIDEASGIPYTKMINYQGEPINIEYLPQNLEVSTTSTNNRDSLQLSSLEFGSTTNYYNSVPEYYDRFYKRAQKTLSDKLNNLTERLIGELKDAPISTKKQIIDQTIESWNHLLEVNILKHPEYPLVINYEDNGSIVDDGKPYYILIDDTLVYCCYDKLTNTNNNLYDSNTGIINITGGDGELISRELYSDIIFVESPHSALDLIIAYFNKNETESLMMRLRNSIITLKLLKGIVLTNIKNFNISLDYNKSDQIRAYIASEISSIKFWSKTIGKETTSLDDITVGIEKSLADNTYIVTISKYNYKETYVGKFTNLENGEERLDFLISKQSKLVYCSVNKKAIDILDIPTGKWIMKGATALNGNTETGLKHLIYSIDTVHPDFLLIPDSQKFTSQNWQENLLDDCKKYNFQVLIQDSDYKNNLLTDTDNYLVHFYKTIKFKNNNLIFPSYYLFVRGLIQNDLTYKNNDILYDSPLDYTKVDPFSNDRNNLISELEKYKCNYLVDSGQYYFYEKFFNGNKSETSMWMRFALEKIKRELEKCKQRITGSRNSTTIRKEIFNSLQRITQNFSIIRGINIKEYFYDPGNGNVYLQLETSISDLVDQNITLDLTLNFNKINN